VKLKLTRNSSSAECTLGDLSLDGEHFCFTCEDVVREQEGVPVKDWKIAGKSAIPRGTYQVIVNHSQRFKRELPLLLNVPGFTGVRIHPGNTADDTEGCILVGEKLGEDSVLESRMAFGRLMVEIEAALDSGDLVHIEIT
jgi:hypothetical protein